MACAPAHIVVELWHEALQLGDQDWFESLTSDDVVLTGLGRRASGITSLVARLDQHGASFRLLRVFADGNRVVVKQHHEVHDPDTGRLLDRSEIGSIFTVRDGQVASIDVRRGFDRVWQTEQLSNRHEKEPTKGAWAAWHSSLLGQRPRQHLEFVLYSDSVFDGPLTEYLGPFTVQHIESEEPPETGAAHPALRLIGEVGDSSPRVGERVRTLTSAWHGGDLGDEFAALVSLLLGVRLRGSGLDRGGFIPPDGEQMLLHEQPRRVPYLAPPELACAPMLPGIARTVSLAEARDMLATLPDLPDEVQRPLTRAARQFSLGLWEADTDPNLAWLRLVGALESAAESVPDFDGSDAELVALGWPTMAAALDDAPKSVVTRVCTLLRRQTMVGWKLRTFVHAHPPPEPPRRPRDPWDRVDWNDLERLLGHVYEHRSAALHGGRPFPAFLCSPPLPFNPGVTQQEWPGGGGWSGDGSWAPEDLPMHLHVFAHIVRESLLGWWRRSL